MWLPLHQNQCNESVFFFFFFSIFLFLCIGKGWLVVPLYLSSHVALVLSLGCHNSNNKYTFLCSYFLFHLIFIFHPLFHHLIKTLHSTRLLFKFYIKLSSYFYFVFWFGKFICKNCKWKKYVFNVSYTNI